ncbi:hypothetical protein BRD13_06475 [Halobacteriales archaeon SW_5_70_135]|nr:MAG: hypothetical protein BRD13_06475 [Halobacteriales archaeon SW_5_70_135]
MTEADSPGHGAYRRFVEARFDPAALDVSEDRVRIARLGDDAFRSLRALSSRSHRLERTLLRALAGLAARREGASAMALAAAADAAASRADLQVTYWERVVDPEEHARGNDLTGLDADRWEWETGTPRPALTRLHEATEALHVDPAPEALVETRARVCLVAGLLGRGLYALTAATADGAGTGLPTLSGLVDGTDHALTTVDLTTELAVELLDAVGDADPSALAGEDDSATRLRAALPSVPAGVPLEAVVEEVTREYEAHLRAIDE